MRPQTEIPENPLGEAGEIRPEVDREELIEYLESDQLVEQRAQPVPRRRLSRRARILLWGLRVFVIVVGTMVIYTFYAQLG